MRVLGVDPGLNITGYGILEISGDDISVVEAGVIKNDPKTEMEIRLLEIGKELQSLISQFRPDYVAVEELYSNYKHPKTAIIMGHARGIIFLKAAEAKIPVIPYASTKVKNALTGNGRASKQQMQHMVRSTLSLSSIPEPPDVADALAVALCHVRTIQHDQAVNL